MEKGFFLILIEEKKNLTTFRRISRYFFMGLQIFLYQGLAGLSDSCCSLFCFFLFFIYLFIYLTSSGRSFLDLESGHLFGVGAYSRLGAY